MRIITLALSLNPLFAELFALNGDGERVHGSYHKRNREGVRVKIRRVGVIRREHCAERERDQRLSFSENPSRGQDGHKHRRIEDQGVQDHQRNM